MGTSLFLLLLLSTTQAPAHYKSPNALFTPSLGYVVCSNCPPPSNRGMLRQKGSLVSFNFPHGPMSTGRLVVAGPPASAHSSIRPSAATAVKPSVTQGRGVPVFHPAPSLPSQPLKSDGPERLVSKRVLAHVEQAVRNVETIYFDFDSVALKPSARAKLDKLRKKDITAVTGYTDNVGPKKYNDALALRRAATVVSYLRSTVPPEGKGRCCYVSPTDNTLNRRVQIVYETKTINERKGAK